MSYEGFINNNEDGGDLLLEDTVAHIEFDSIVVTNCSQGNFSFENIVCQIIGAKREKTLAFMGYSRRGLTSIILIARNYLAELSICRMADFINDGYLSSIFSNPLNQAPYLTFDIIEGNQYNVKLQPLMEGCLIDENFHIAVVLHDNQEQIDLEDLFNEERTIF
jgi:hypothetical protein